MPLDTNGSGIPTEGFVSRRIFNEAGESEVFDRAPEIATTWWWKQEISHDD
jgi:hypothetical protein